MRGEAIPGRPCSRTARNQSRPLQYGTSFQRHPLSPPAPPHLPLTSIASAWEVFPVCTEYSILGPAECEQVVLIPEATADAHVPALPTHTCSHAWLDGFFSMSLMTTVCDSADELLNACSPIPHQNRQSHAQYLHAEQTGQKVPSPWFWHGLAIHHAAIHLLGAMPKQAPGQRRINALPSQTDLISPYYLLQCDTSPSRDVQAARPG